MTKDLALITSLENPVVLNSQQFILAIRENLEAMLSKQNRPEERELPLTYPMYKCKNGKPMASRQGFPFFI